MMFDAFIPDNFHIFMQYKNTMKRIERATILQINGGLNWNSFQTVVYDTKAPPTNIINIVFEVKVNSTYTLAAAIDNLIITNGSCLKLGKKYF